MELLHSVQSPPFPQMGSEVQPHRSNSDDYSNGKYVVITIHVLSWATLSFHACHFQQSLSATQHDSLAPILSCKVVRTKFRSTIPKPSVLHTCTHTSRNKQQLQWGGLQTCCFQKQQERGPFIPSNRGQWSVRLLQSLLSFSFYYPCNPVGLETGRPVCCLHR